MKINNDTKGSFVFDWIISLIGLLLIGIAYAIAVPLGNVLIGIFVENGAPVAQLLFIRQMVIWGFALLGGLCLAFAFMSSYRKTYDQGQDGYRGW